MSLRRRHLEDVGGNRVTQAAATPAYQSRENDYVKRPSGKWFAEVRVERLAV
jgi:hypothetical protein